MKQVNGRRMALLGVSAVLMVVSTSACGANTNGSPTATRPVVEQVAEADRTTVDPFSGRLLDGNDFDSTDLLGAVVVYNVWGSWCAPCRTEAPELAQVAADTADSGTRFVGINVRDNDAAARAFADRYDLGYPSLTTDTSSAALLAFGPALPPSAVPSTMVVDADGRLAARVIGPVDASTLRALIADATQPASGRATP